MQDWLDAAQSSSKTKPGVWFFYSSGRIGKNTNTNTNTNDTNTNDTNTNDTNTNDNDDDILGSVLSPRDLSVISIETVALIMITDNSHNDTSFRRQNSR